MGGHGKAHNKSHMTAKEWKEDWGGKKEGTEIAKAHIPFYCCELSMQPFQDPVITPDGDYHCPITFKIFNDHSKILCIKTTGNVFSGEAVEELNIKAKNMNDLMSGDPFTRADIFTIQDPQNRDARIVNPEAVRRSMAELADAPKVSDSINLTGSTKRVLSAMRAEDVKSATLIPSTATISSTGISKTEPVLPPSKKVKGGRDDEIPGQLGAGADAGKVALTHLTTGRAAQGFTSTAFVPVTKHEHIMVERKKFPKRKAYVRLVTNLGNLNIELECPLAPKTCENFIALCKKGAYDNTIFHRSIKNFMIQGGDPTGTGKGGASIWGKDFEDEFTGKLSHKERGVLSMANRGPKTNGSQFFILYKPAPHLDYKHTVFGKVVGGIDVLREMENIDCDKKDKPVTDIKILQAIVFQDPYEDEDIYKSEAQLLEEKKQKEINDKIARKESEKGQWFSNPLADKESTRSSAVGKYLPQ